MFYNHHFAVLVIVIPMFLALLTPIISLLKMEFAWYMAMLSATASFLISMSILYHILSTGDVILYHLGGWLPPIGIEYRIDCLNGFVLVVITFIALISTIYAKQSVAIEIKAEKTPAFYTVFMLFLLGLYGMIVTNDVFNLYVFLEITSLTGYALVAMGSDKRSLMASFNYLILGTIGATFILIGVGYLYMITGTLNMIDMSRLLVKYYDSNVMFTAFAFIITGLMLKVALYPLHFWLPSAYTYAPSAVSAVMAATSTKVAAYVMIRLFFTVFHIKIISQYIPVAEIVMIIASISVLMGSILAISQTDIKRMLAYSSIGQIGYIVLGATVLHSAALTGGILHILNHALMKCGLFFVAGSIFYKLGTTRINDLRNLSRIMPLQAGAFTLLALSMIGIPLTGGFVTKWYLIEGSILSGDWYLVPVILLSSLLTVIYFGRVINLMYFSDNSSHNNIKPIKAPLGMVVPTIIITFLSILFGIFATVPVEIASKAAIEIMGGSHW